MQQIIYAKYILVQTHQTDLKSTEPVACIYGQNSIV